MYKHKTCSFFGHRKIEISQDLKEKLKLIIEDLIINQNVTTFLFGSKSEFNDLCHLVVNELKVKYPYIKRVAYTCKSETCILESEKEKWTLIFSNFLKGYNSVLAVDEEYEYKNKYVAGKASYVERNQAMILNSDYCVFYYNEDYKNTKSGTKIAFYYAKEKGKMIINLSR